MKDILNRVISGDLSVVDVLVREALDDANVVKKDDLNNSVSLVLTVSMHNPIILEMLISNLIGYFERKYNLTKIIHKNKAFYV